MSSDPFKTYKPTLQEFYRQKGCKDAASKIKALEGILEGKCAIKTHDNRDEAIILGSLERDYLSMYKAKEQRR